MSSSNFIKMVEVGPRDGLQNEPKVLPTATKISLINQLSETGLQVIEAGSFVSPRWIPQMADSGDILQGIQQKDTIQYPVLVPNLTGFNNALSAGAKSIAIFTSPSNTFNQKNIHCSVAESLKRFEPVMALANTQNIPVRGYISCVLGCPYEGKIHHSQVVRLAEQLINLGCYEVSLGDTIGIGTPKQVKSLLASLMQSLPAHQLAVHFHDTYGQALANILTALEMGITVIDSAVAGLGGCPYARGATGNVASEDVLYLLNGLGLKTGVDLYKLIDADTFICQQLKRTTRSKVAFAMRGYDRETPS